MTAPTDQIAPALVTGEAVAVELRPARLPSRALAFGIDLVVQVAILVAINLVGARTIGSADAALQAALALVALVLVAVGYPVLWETLTRGRSLGKLAMGLRVVRDDGGPIRFRQALVRGLAAFFVDLWLTLGVVAVFVSLVSRRGKRVGDVMAGTIVLQERVPARQAGAPYVPRALEGWARQLDLSGLSDALALHARQFMARAPQFDPRVRENLGQQVAAAVAASVAPPPPPGTTGYDLVAAVLAERRRRDLERLTAATASAATATAATAAPAGPHAAVPLEAPRREAAPEPPESSTGFRPPA